MTEATELVMVSRIPVEEVLEVEEVDEELEEEEELACWVRPATPWAWAILERGRGILSINVIFFHLCIKMISVIFHVLYFPYLLSVAFGR